MKKLQHSTERILTADEIMKSPGIPEKNDLVKKLEKRESVSSVKWSWPIAIKGNSKIIAITGSNGKTTNYCLNVSYL
jgi:UDP-N-acetylmuramoylalanine--D-glutamate ligase